MIELRVRTHAHAQFNNAAQVVTLDRRYEFAALAAMIDEGLAHAGRIAVRTSSGQPFVVDVDSIHMLAIREVR